MQWVIAYHLILTFAFACGAIAAGREQLRALGARSSIPLPLLALIGTLLYCVICLAWPWWILRATFAEKTRVPP